MKNLVLIVFVLGIARSQVCFFTQNCITSESRINVTRPNDALECLADCKKQNGCKWWTYDPDPDWCALMKDCHQPPDYQCRACTSGEVTCEQYRCGITGLCLGEELEHSVTPFKDSCIRRCKSEVGCQWYSYNGANQDCILLSTCDRIDESEVDFISGQHECRTYGKLLVTTGFPADASVKSEVIDLVDASNTCQDLDDYPFQAQGAVSGLLFQADGAVGGLLNPGDPLVCGGYSNKECYIVGQSGPKDQLLEQRYMAASLVLNHSHIWITGGFSNSGPLASTELVSMAQPIVSGPDLPISVAGHCLVAINASTALLIGGGDASNGVYIGESYYISLEDQSWSQGPDLISPRWMHACGVFKSRAHQGRTVVIVAAGNKNNPLDSVELLELATNTWIEGPSLPKNISYHSMVTSPDGQGVIVIGGATFIPTEDQSALYQLNCNESGCEWHEMEQKLKIARERFVAMLIPDILTNCSKP